MKRARVNNLISEVVVAQIYKASTLTFYNISRIEDSG